MNDLAKEKAGEVMRTDRKTSKTMNSYRKNDNEHQGNRIKREKQREVNKNVYKRRNYLSSGKQVFFLICQLLMSIF